MRTAAAFAVPSSAYTPKEIDPATKCRKASPKGIYPFSPKNPQKGGLAKKLCNFYIRSFVFNNFSGGSFIFNFIPLVFTAFKPI